MRDLAIVLGLGALAWLALRSGARAPQTDAEWRAVIGQLPAERKRTVSERLYEDYGIIPSSMRRDTFADVGFSLIAGAGTVLTGGALAPVYKMAAKDFQ